MKRKRCQCGVQFDYDKRRAYKQFLPDGTCAICGRPGYAKRLDKEWYSPTFSQPIYPQYPGHDTSSPQKIDYSMPVYHYFFQSLAKSSINGISNCSSSSSVVGKLIWCIVFCFSVTGFLYQASHFYRLFQSKPSVVQIEVENDGEVDFPAVTVCNTNR